MQDFTDKVVVVTGAASGMGRAYAVEFAKEGATLSLCDVDEVGLAETVELVKPYGDPTAFSQLVDVSSESAMLDFAADSKAALGDASIVINNAGIIGSGNDGVATSVKDLEKVMGVNFYGVVHGTLAFMPQLEAVAEAALVNVSSVFGMIGAPGNADYCATKFAVRGYSEVLMGELDHTHIRVILVHPGGIRTNIVKDHEDAERILDEFLSSPPEDVAKAVIAAIRNDKRRVVEGNLGGRMQFMGNFLPMKRRAKMFNKEFRERESS